MPWLQSGHLALVTIQFLKGCTVDLKQIKELMQAMGRAGIRHLEIKQGDFELKMDYGDKDNGSHERFVEVPLVRGDMRSSAPAPLPLFGEPQAPVTAAVAEGVFVTSPMVGTFYPSPSPEDAAFVSVGDKVDKNTVVCIIEAMKVMNEVKAGISGTIEEIMIDNSHPVEFGSKLFRIKPAS